MPILFTGLAQQSTTEPADLFVMHNSASDITKKISYQNLKNEIQADINAVTQAQLTTAIANLTAAYQAADRAVLEAVFQVGSRISLNSGPNIFVNPATYLGFGTWVWEQGYYYMGITAGVPIEGFIRGVGGTFGSFTHNHGGATGDTTLNSTQIPSHSHTYDDTFHTEHLYTASGYYRGPNEYLENRGFSGVGTNGTDGDNDAFLYRTRTTSAVGGTQAHNHTIPAQSHMPPTMVESVWRRIA